MPPPPAKTASRVLASGLGGFGGQCEARFVLLIGWTEGDSSDRTDWDDQLLGAVVCLHRQREETEAGLARDRLEG